MDLAQRFGRDGAYRGMAGPGYRRDPGRFDCMVEVNPWTPEPDALAAMLYRGVIVSAWGFIETHLNETAVRCSWHPAYMPLLAKYPRLLNDRLQYLRRVLEAPGPLQLHRTFGQSFIDRFAASAALRNTMAHARMQLLPPMGIKFTEVGLSNATAAISSRSLPPWPEKPPVLAGCASGSSCRSMSGGFCPRSRPVWRRWRPNLQSRAHREDDVLSTPLDHSALEGAQLLKSAQDATVRVARAWFLRFLRWGGGASNKLLVGVLFEDIGLRLSHATMDECAAWLADQGYVRIEVFETTTAYRLTRLGNDVARGIVGNAGLEPICLCDVEADETVIGGLRAR